MFAHTIRNNNIPFGFYPTSEHKGSFYMKQPSENRYLLHQEYQANLQHQRNLEEQIASLQQQLYQQSHNSYSSQSHNSTYFNIDEPFSIRNSTSTSTSIPQRNSTFTSQHNSIPKSSTPAQPKLMNELIADYKKTDKYKRENPDLPDKKNSFQNPFFMNTSMAHVGLY